MPIRRLAPPTIKKQKKSLSPSSTESSGDTARPAKRTRARKPKSKTGCLTCKIRRVKCDETRPACDRCTSTGRKCDGFVTLPEKKPAQKPSMEFQICTIVHISQGSWAENRALEFFRVRTAPGLSSYFDADFWTRIVLQAGHSEPAIRHAMVAVGTLSERRELQLNTMQACDIVVLDDPCAPNVPFIKQAEDYNHPFAVAQYNKAISHLARRIEHSSTESAEVALLACILFICFEFLRSDDGLAIRHFQAGMKIALDAASRSSQSSRSQMQVVRQHMLPFFQRLELLSMLFGFHPPWEYPVQVPQAVPEGFTSLNEARDKIVHIMNLCMRFIRRTRSKCYNSTVTDDDVREQSDLLGRLQDWKQAFDLFLTSRPLSIKDIHAANVLDIHRIVACCWLKRTLNPGECCTDLDIPDYEFAVCLAEMLQVDPAAPDQRIAPSTFLFDMEVVSPLYFVATKCRHPVIRRRAITLLRSSVRREGLWDSNVAAAVAERVMQIEEKGLSTLDGSQLPAEEMRICNTRIEHKSGLHTHVHLEFFSFPNGRGEKAMISWKEVIVMQP